MNYIIEEQRKTEISESCDVLVVGGGIAGVAAAIAAARNGAKVTLVDREFELGGLATLGLIAIYLPICDGMGHQVSFGLAEELLRMSVKRGAQQPLNACWMQPNGSRGEQEERRKYRFQVQFNPNLYALETERYLKQIGVRILYGTFAAGVSLKDNRIDAVIIENKSGRSAIRPKVVIDSTGDADVCYLAKAPTKTYDKKNGLASWYYYQKGGQPSKLRMFGLADVVSDDPDSNIGNETVDTLTSRRYSATNAEELNQMVQDAHEKMYEDILKKNAEDPSCVPVSISAIPLVRMSRRLCGAYEMKDSQTHEYMSDSIGMIGDWRKRGPVYEIPYRSLYCQEMENLLVAGRDISVDDSMWDITRVIPACSVTGQAAGTAAALTDQVRDLDVSLLQRKLREQGVVLHWNDLTDDDQSQNVKIDAMNEERGPEI